MIVPRSRHFGLAPAGSSGGPWVQSPTVYPTTTWDVMGYARAQVARFAGLVNAILSAPGRLSADASRLAGARTRADANLSGNDRAQALYALDQLDAENQQLTARVRAAADIVSAGQQRVAQLADALGVSGFGIAPVLILGIVAALAAISAALASIVNAVTVHSKAVDTESRKLDAVLAGTLPPEALQQQDGNGGGIGLPDVGRFLPWLLVLAAVPVLRSIGGR